MTRGQGFSTELDGFHLRVEAMAEGWQFSIRRIEGGEPLVAWTNGPAPSTASYAEPEGTKFEAVTTAMGILQRADDPHAIFQNLTWRRYGPGH
jgi:hypothetical protein